MLFRQLFDRETCTYTYLLADAGLALLIDPVREHVERELTLLDELGLTLAWVAETHVHADHVTGAGTLADRTGCRIAYPASSGAQGADRYLADGDVLEVGSVALTCRHTPGHTAGCAIYVGDGMAFTGDTLLIRGCGRTDFQEGDARALYRSVHERIFSLPDGWLLYPGHDYNGRTVTTVAEEKAHNPRLGGGRDVESFVALMAGLGLAYPKRIDEAVPANLKLGR